MAVLRIIPAGDLAIEKGNLVELGGTPETHVRYVRQKLAARFRFFLGEWFLNQNEGAPYIRDVFVKNPNLDVVRSMFLKLIRETPGVLDVVGFAMVYDPRQRTLAFSFQARVEGGDIVVKPEDRDFILNLAA
jgi:hypothetical protein